LWTLRRARTDHRKAKVRRCVDEIDALVSEDYRTVRLDALRLQVVREGIGVVDGSFSPKSGL